MKTLVLIVLSVLWGWCGSVSADICASIYYIPFDAELYMPESEASIENRAFYTQGIDARRFINMLTHKKPSTEYDKKNVRVKIKYRAETYYIDRYGVVRHGQSFSYFNTERLDGLLSKKCSAK